MGDRPAAGPGLRLAQHPDADALLSRDPFALVVGMLLDQQVPMEKAFTGPWVLAQRLGADRLDPAEVAAVPPERFAAMMAGPPAVHRYHASMGSRVQALAAYVVEHYRGDVERLWVEAADGADLRRRLEALPGFGAQKAKIFVALLGKQLGVRPAGWREAAEEYGPDDATRSVADVRDAATLAAVRETKRRLKAAKKAAAGP
ncbi:MAG: HhH-GPD-type base excision DNA repair protein [Actinomycetes bacterium]